jgi:hypothetical protein
LLIIPAYRFMEKSWPDTIRVVFVTDTLGLCVLVGAFLITRVDALGRLLLGTMLLLSSWTLTVIWEPAIPSLAWRLKDFLVGDLRDRWLDYNFPPLPWLGLYLIASAAGAAFARAHDSRQEKSYTSRIALLGLGLLGAAFMVRAVCRGLVAHGAGSAFVLDHLAAMTHKLPPSPTYMLFHSGLALLMFAALLLFGRVAAGRAFTRWVALFGRYSMAAFLFQFYFYYLGVTVLPRPPVALAPLYFVATLVLLRLLTSAWARLGGNRLITVGYPALKNRAASQAPAATGARRPDHRPDHRALRTTRSAAARSRPVPAGRRPASRDRGAAAERSRAADLEAHPRPPRHLGREHACRSTRWLPRRSCRPCEATTDQSRHASATCSSTGRFPFGARGR